MWKPENCFWKLRKLFVQDLYNLPPPNKNKYNVHLFSSWPVLSYQPQPHALFPMYNEVMNIFFSSVISNVFEILKKFKEKAQVHKPLQK